MYVIELIFTCPAEEVEPQVQPHLDYLDVHYQTRDFIASGAKNPRDGGIILANGALSRERLDSIIREDPFHQQGLAEYRVVEFIADKYDAAIAPLING